MAAGMRWSLGDERLHGGRGDVLEGVEGVDGGARKVGELGLRKGVVGSMRGAEKTHDTEG